MRFRFAELRDSPEPPAPDEVGYASADHHGSDVGLGPDAIEHDRRVGYQPLIAYYLYSLRMISRKPKGIGADENSIGLHDMFAFGA